jgi:hypothetical protein
VPLGQSADVVHGLPVFVPPLQIALPNAPFCVVVWPGQKMPVASDLLATSVVSGLRAIGMSPMKVAQRPPGQSVLVAQTALLFVPLKQRCPPLPETAAGDGQSLESPLAFFDVQAAP